MSPLRFPPPLPPRSVLYGRSPAGVGTPLVESLSGYLARLCTARAVRIVDVLDRLVRPLVPEDTLPPYRELSWLLVQQFVDFDGLGRPAEALVGALAQLTGRADLAGHTFLPWRRLFSAHRSGVVRRATKRWCARCLDEWHAHGVEPWEPLLWRLAPAEWCPVHRVPLSHRCPSCGRRLRLVTERVPPGHCERCGVLLHRGDPALGAKPLDRRASRDVLWGWWISVALGRMLGAQADAVRHASAEGFVRLINDAIARPGSGVLPLARHLGVTSTPLLRWRVARSSIGAACTLDSGATFNVEHHFDANGYSADEWDAIAGVIVDNNVARSDERFRRLANGNLLRLSAHFARFTMRRHYGFVRAHHPGLFGRDLALEMTVLHGLADHSGSMGLRLEHEIGPNLLLGVEGRWRYGGRLDEFAQRTGRLSGSIHATVYF